MISVWKHLMKPLAGKDTELSLVVNIRNKDYKSTFTASVAFSLKKIYKVTLEWPGMLSCDILVFSGKIWKGLRAIN